MSTEYEGSPRSYVMTEQDQSFKIELVDRLRLLAPKFLEIRQKMGVAEEIGLASLPLAHEGYTSNMVTTIEIDSLGDVRYGTQINFGLGMGKELLPSDGSEGAIVVMPQENGKQMKAVSIYQRRFYPLPKFSLEENKFIIPSLYQPEVRLVTASEQVFEGFFAHELAHCLVDGGYKLPEYIEDVLMQRRQEAKTLSEKEYERYSQEFDSTDHSEIDIIAALFGYKEQVLAQLQYVIDGLKTYPASDRRGEIHTSPLDAIKSLEIRMSEVRRYC